MLLLLIAVAVVVTIVVGFIRGLYLGFRDIKNGVTLESYYNGIDTPQEIPYYINEQITAIYNQIASNNELIKVYRDKIEITRDIEKIALYNKRVSDLEYKCSKLEEKVYKLLEKWEG